MIHCPACREPLQFAAAAFCPSCGFLVRSIDPLLGQVVGSRYRIRELIAEGGMGRVYLADQAMGETSRKVAVKVLLSEYSGRDQDMQRFSRECSTVTELEHPNTIKFFDFGNTPDGDLFIAMEFLSGPSLAQILKEGPLPYERVDLILGQICGSLQEAHDRGIVHRDLKPDNIILTSPGGAPDFVKVLDFGIAKRTGGRDPKLTPLGVVLGSPPYMSPEQFTLQDVDAKSDIYSLGVVAYQMLTGRLPFTANEPLEWAALHMGAKPAPMDVSGLEIPHEMRQAVERALQKRPNERHLSMREFYSSFTVGAGSLTPGRLSSMIPLDGTQIPRPPRLLGERASSRPPDERRSDAPNLPTIASTATDRQGSSAPPPAQGERRTSHGTLMLDPAEARAPERHTMPDLVPPTVRDPGHLQGPGRRFRYVWLAVLLVLIGAALSALGWLVLVRRSPNSTKLPGSSKPSAARVDPPISASVESSGLIPSAIVTPSAAVTAAPSICEQAIFSAVSGNCTTARTIFGRCSTSHPLYEKARRTMDGLCP